MIPPLPNVVSSAPIGIIAGQFEVAGEDEERESAARDQDFPIRLNDHGGDVRSQAGKTGRYFCIDSEGAIDVPSEL
jgi:hypothetical protein